MVAHMMAARGRLHRGYSNYADALECYRSAAELYRKLGRRQDEATSLACVGGCEMEAGNSAAAKEILTQTLAIQRTLETPRMATLALTLSNLSYAHGNLGEHEEALRCALDAVDSYRIVNRPESGGVLRL